MQSLTHTRAHYNSNVIGRETERDRVKVRESEGKKWNKIHYGARSKMVKMVA